MADVVEIIETGAEWAWRRITDQGRVLADGGPYPTETATLAAARDAFPGEIVVTVISSDEAERGGSRA